MFDRGTDGNLRIVAYLFMRIAAMHTSGGGASWTPQPSETSNSLFGVDFSDSTRRSGRRRRSHGPHLGWWADLGTSVLLDLESVQP